MLGRRAIADIDWQSFVKAEAFFPHCTDCRTFHGRVGFFCLDCKTTGVALWENSEHVNHRWLTVIQYEKKSAVRTVELGRYLHADGRKCIQTYGREVNEKVCYLRTRGKGQASSSSRRTCQSCKFCTFRICKRTDANLAFVVCSLECLLKVANLHPELNLLRETQNLTQNAPDSALRPSCEGRAQAPAEAHEVPPEAKTYSAPDDSLPSDLPDGLAELEEGFPMTQDFQDWWAEALPTSALWAESPFGLRLIPAEEGEEPIGGNKED